MNIKDKNYLTDPSKSAHVKIQAITITAQSEVVSDCGKKMHHPPNIKAGSSRP